MFYLMGSPRSGTTILAQCISAHPALLIPDETDFIVPVAFIAQSVKDTIVGKELISKVITHGERFPFSIGEYLTESEITAAVSEADYSAQAMLKSVYGQLARAVGKQLAGDKSPNDLLSLRQLVVSGAIGPESTVIHIVRDIRDVMASLKRTGWVPDIEAFFPRMWSSTNLYLDHVKRDSSNYLLIRYEDFVVDPAKTLKAVCELLQVNFDEAMLAPTGRHERYKDVAHHSNIYRPISGRSVGAFSREFSEETLSGYVLQAREALQRYGYI